MVSLWYVRMSLLGNLQQYSLYLSEIYIYEWCHEIIHEVLNPLFFTRFPKFEIKQHIGTEALSLVFSLQWSVGKVGKIPSIYHVVLWSFCCGLSACFRLGEGVDTKYYCPVAESQQWRHTVASLFVF